MDKTVVKRIPRDLLPALGKIDPNLGLALRVLLKEHSARPAQLTLESIKQAAKEGCANAIAEANGG